MIKSITVREISNSLRQPFITALRTVTSYPVIRVEIELETGEVGVGECVATPQISGDNHEEILAQLNSLRGSREIAPERLNEFFPSTRAAIDLALWNTRNDYPVANVKTDVTIPIAPLADIQKLVKERLDSGFSSFKVKVAASPLADLLERIDLIRESAGSEVMIRIDPNQAWGVDYACKAAVALGKSGANIEYLEQPLAKSDIAGHVELAKESPIPLMADESCFSLTDLDRIIESEAFTFLNVKLLKAGGITSALKLAELAKVAGLKVSIGSMMEGELGIRAAIYLANEIAPDEIHDLDAAWWFSASRIRYQGSTVCS